MKKFLLAFTIILLLVPMVAQADTVSIILVTWNSGPKTLVVRATSSEQPTWTLNATGYGNLTWSAVSGYYARTFNGVMSEPASVTVTSTGGGSDTWYSGGVPATTSRKRAIQLNISE
jgi:hypothetical protein